MPLKQINVIVDVRKAVYIYLEKESLMIIRYIKLIILDSCLLNWD